MGSVLYTLFIFPIAEVIELAFTALYRVSDNFGVAIIGLSFVVTLCTLPIYMVAEHWQEVERNKVAEMAPEVKKIRKVFKGDERFMLLSAYYRECDYKPIYALRSSFSILIQIPFFLAAYLFLSNHPDLKGLSFWFIKDLGAPDGMINIAGRTFNLLPIIMTSRQLHQRGDLLQRTSGKREGADLRSCRRLSGDTVRLSRGIGPLLGDEQYSVAGKEHFLQDAASASHVVRDFLCGVSGDQWILFQAWDRSEMEDLCHLRDFVDHLSYPPLVSSCQVVFGHLCRVVM
ncbi:MAG: YidC/Oxa1 family membrane protein insertase [Sphaerochaeta sp.]|jgi:hypothetical protein|nr:YidC/Oxa1 family membrane protein insertase [Sphaerochaeta sp.]